MIRAYRFTTSRTCRFSIIAILLLSLIALAVIFARPKRVAQAHNNPARKQQCQDCQAIIAQRMTFPYYSIEGTWEATLGLNNPTHNPLTATITLYALNGQELRLSDQTIPAKQHRALRLGDLISQAGGNGRFNEGSVEVKFTGPRNGLGAHLTVADLDKGYSFDMEPPTGLKSSRLEGVWWSIDEKTSGRVMLSNTTNQPLNVQLTVDWQSAALMAPALSLGPRQTAVVDIEKLLKDIHVNIKGIGQGGLLIAHNGPAGGLIAHGYVQSKNGRYASNLNFIAPSAQQSKSLEAAGLMLGRPASKKIFPTAAYFTPVLALRNASDSPQTATVTLQYTTSGNFQSVSLPAVSLAPHEVKMANFSPVMQALGNTPVDGAGLKLESSGEAGTLIAQLTSLNNGTMCVVDIGKNVKSRRKRSGQYGAKDYFPE